MTRFIFRPKLQNATAIAITLTVLALGTGSRSLAQMSAESPSDTAVQQSPSAISAHDLANLVAPIALYPDALLGQVSVSYTHLDVYKRQVSFATSSTR